MCSPTTCRYECGRKQPVIERIELSASSDGVDVNGSARRYGDRDIRRDGGRSARSLMRRMTNRPKVESLVR